ncbi:hypothetical protein FPCIR_8750 [Fusarium pseudocircinatum]|uniref:Ankyrin repeat protein n=1 Tax=Fusarium pseudocircinatum TaxID=56676 RepID=A0A8H5NZB8_9HYPO|nr:hypothetical protein FPCIR_8750 [Fusarium pseudocircinatum]
MAEAFGIAGSAFGTVSLGIQLFTEISNYLNSVEGRDDDLERAKNYALDFHSSLIALETLASTTGISDTDLERVINQGQANCASAINSLSKMVAELKSQDPIPNSRASKARALYVKLKYPFKKQNLENLEKQLFNTVSVLKFALTILQVKSAHIIQMSVQSMERALLNRPSRPLEPGGANGNNLAPVMDETIAETSSDSTICLRDPTSKTPVSAIKATRYQNGSIWTMDSFCVCRKNFKRRERRQWGPFIIENEMSFTDYHSPGCPLSTQEPLEQQTKRTLKSPIPFVQGRWRTASQFSLFFTAGTGGMGFGQSLAWVETVDRNQSPLFEIVRVVMSPLHRLANKETEVFLSSCYRRLKWCFANRKASITDVDESGESLVDDISKTYWMFDSGRLCFPHEFLQIFCLLVPFINPATHTGSSTGCGDSAGQDCKSLYPWSGRCGKFDLIKGFPQISNYLEYGRLSRLVLLEDQDKVKDHLANYPSSIHEINYLGQTPIHIAVQTQNATILSVLVNHAVPRVLNAQDNNGYYAIDHAMDIFCHARKSGKDSRSKVCNGCEVLNVLLCSESAIFTDSVRIAMPILWGDDISTCIEALKNIIRSLAARRKELKTLAQRELTPAERQTLKFCQAGILDQNAAQTQRFLEANKCHVPMRLKVYDCEESPEDSESIYLLISHGDAAESALQSGFPMPTTLFGDDSPHPCGISGTMDTLLTQLEYLCDLLGHVGYDLTKEHWIDSVAIRHFTIVSKASGPLSTADRREIEEEDHSRLELFEQLVAEFETERGNSVDLLSFAREYLAPRMEAVHGEIDSYILTETQRQSAEEAGVVWECYGPQLPLRTVVTKNEEEILQDQVLCRKGK